MNKGQQQRVVVALLQRHGKTYAEEVGIRLRNTPAPLFQLLVAALLFSARIGAPQAAQAASALRRCGLTTARKMADASWEERVRILNQNGYARYDESTSRMLGDTACIVLEKYGGDLRNMRAAAGGETAVMEKRLQEFKGIGPAGAAIFLREVQAVWEEFCPYIDDRARQGAQALGLPVTAELLADLAGNPLCTAQLAAALVRMDLADDADAVRAAAKE